MSVDDRIAWLLIGSLIGGIAHWALTLLIEAQR